MSASLVFGAAIHRAIEHHFRQRLQGAPTPNLDDLLDQYQAEWLQRDSAEVRFGASESKQSLDEVAGRLLASFQVNSVARPLGTILAVEEELQGPVIEGLPELRGILDLIVETPTELVITDWKTARARWSEFQIEDAGDQLQFYAELARDLAPTKSLHVELVVLTKTKRPVIDRHRMPVDAAGLERTRRIVEQVWRAIQGEHFFPAPSPLACGGCSFREPCRGWPA